MNSLKAKCFNLSVCLKTPTDAPLQRASYMGLSLANVDAVFGSIDLCIRNSCPTDCLCYGPYQSGDASRDNQNFEQPAQFQGRAWGCNNCTSGTLSTEFSQHSYMVRGYVPSKMEVTMDTAENYRCLKSGKTL